RRNGVLLPARCVARRGEPARHAQPSLHAPAREPGGSLPQAHRKGNARMRRLGISRAWMAVWRRNYLVWKKLAAESVLGNIIEPLFYLVGFGLGFGSMLPEVDGVR